MMAMLPRELAGDQGEQRLGVGLRQAAGRLVEHQHAAADRHGALYDLLRGDQRANQSRCRMDGCCSSASARAARSPPWRRRSSRPRRTGDAEQNVLSHIEVEPPSDGSGDHRHAARRRGLLGCRPARTERRRGHHARVGPLRARQTPMKNVLLQRRSGRAARAPRPARPPDRPPSLQWRQALLRLAPAGAPRTFDSNLGGFGHSATDSAGRSGRPRDSLPPRPFLEVQFSSACASGVPIASRALISVAPVSSSCRRAAPPGGRPSPSAPAWWPS